MRINKNSRGVVSQFIQAAQAAIEPMERRVLMSTGPVTGFVYNDTNGDGIHQSTEPALAGQKVYTDLNNNGKYDAGEHVTVESSAIANTNFDATWCATINVVSKTYPVASVKNLLINGLSGNDSMTVSSAITLNSTLYGGAGNDTISAGSGADLLYGNDGNDTLFSNAGSDTIHGGNGNDSLDGGAGDDWLYGADGNDTLNGALVNNSFYGGDGNDTADYSQRTENLQLHIGFGKNGAKRENDFIGTDIERLIGGSGNDVLNANTNPAEPIGGAGNDTLISGHGGATMLGGDGDDLFEAMNNRSDTIDGGSGNNTAIADSYDVVTNV